MGYFQEKTSHSQVVLTWIYTEAKKRGLVGDNLFNGSFWGLNLLGMTCEMAEVSLTSSLYSFFENFQEKGELKQLEVISGNGVLRHMCENYLQKRDIRYHLTNEENRKILVSEKDLRKLFKRVKKRRFCLL
ncbi:hypothetical protein MHBO_001671 [Bonamia ostreae]|uniref:LAGLIDADG homing endonuclease n=1 Tax=Bonamia ostreae TaxID=126728 RepID=A0ABV2AKX4_9EUKA